MRVVICIVILFVTFLCNAQQRFNRTYVAPWYNIAGSIQFDNSNYYVLGHKIDTINRKITLAKLNMIGDTLQTSVYGETDRAFFAQKLIKRQNDFLVFGGVNFDDFGINSDMFLMSFDLNFSLNWIKYYGGNYFDDGTDFLQNDDGTLLLCGSKSPSSANQENFYLVKTDENGNVLWERTYGGNNIEKAYSIIKCPENEYLISGYSNSFSSSNDLLVYKIDSIGNIIWQKQYGGSFEDFAAIASYLPDKSFILHKNVTQIPQNPVSSLIKINENGGIIWQRDYPATDYSSFEFTKPLALEDGTFIVTRVIYNSQQYPIAQICKMDPMGNILWTRDYEIMSNRSHYIYDIKQTPDDGFVFCGSAYDSLTPNRQQNWVAKLDCFGCDGVLCDLGTSCEVYDCTGKDFSSNFMVSTDTVFTNNNQPVIFTNTSTETSNREWIFPDTTIYTNGTVNYQFNQVGTYNIQLITYHGVCSDTSTQTIVVTWPLGYEDLDIDEVFQVYPNPVKYAMQVKSNFLISEVQIFDLFGRLLVRKPIEAKEAELDVRNLAKGEYLIHALTKEGVLVRRVVKL